MFVLGGLFLEFLHALRDLVVLLGVLAVVLYLGPRLHSREDLIHQGCDEVGGFLHFVWRLKVFGLVDGLDGGVDVNVVLAESLLYLREEDSLGDVAGEKNARESPMRKRATSIFFQTTSAEVGDGNVANVHARESFGATPC